MKNINKFNAAIAALTVLLGISQAQAFDFFGLNKTNEAPLLEGFTCCNLHYEGDWISDSNFGALPFIPAGSRIKLKGYGRHRLHVDIDDKPMRIGLDYGRAQETLEQFAEKLILAEDPKAKIAKYPAEVRDAIRFGQVVTGMTQEQTIIAVGYPQRDETVSLEASVWNYWASSFEPYRVIWGKNGRIKEIATDSATHARMVYRKAE
ncbi:MAG: hypothetical protein Q8R61_12255 [Thiobacillus sp.]|uniref:hypothetical protein n=1 Tax=Thiobacillus sp. TaxID=924 RepID=UPI002733295C|nr:hypothetical protein [Thiobacillus sp.]MDP3585893.1 hypothetical protein [Thiobacillus sp.]